MHVLPPPMSTQDYFRNYFHTYWLTCIYSGPKSLSEEYAITQQPQNPSSLYIYVSHSPATQKRLIQLILALLNLTVTDHIHISVLSAASDDFSIHRHNRDVNSGRVGRRMFVLSVLFEVHRRDEAFRALDALVASFHQVNLRLGVAVEVRLRHALVVAQSTHVLTDSCNAWHR